MQIILGKTAGFCFGVKNAVNKSIEQVEKVGKIYCLGELVHNKQVIEELEQKGVVFIDEVNQAQDRVIIRAHGVTKQVYEQIEAMGLEKVDLTCPRVLKIHQIAEEYVNKGYFIFVVGPEEHPETIGTVSFCGNDYALIEKVEDIQKAYSNFKESKKEKALIIGQTTFNLSKFEMIAEELKNMLKENLEIKNTICEATRLRQEETAEIAKEADLMIIIGGKNSSNSNKLYDIANKYCKDVIFIETKEDLDINHIKKFEKIGIMAGASTPQKSIDNVVEIINKTC